MERNQTVGESLAEEQAAILRQMQATFDYIGEDREAAERHREWFIDGIHRALDHVGPDDLKISETVALYGVLGPIFARTLASGTPPERRSTLRIVV